MLSAGKTMEMKQRGGDVSIIVMTIDLLLHNVTLAVPVHLRSQAHTWPLQGQTVSSANPCRRQPLELLSTIFDAGMLLGWQGASGTSRIELTSSALTRYYTCAVPERLQEMHHFIFTYPLFEDTLSKDTLQERRMHNRTVVIAGAYILPTVVIGVEGSQVFLKLVDRKERVTGWVENLRQSPYLLSVDGETILPPRLQAGVLLSQYKVVNEARGTWRQPQFVKEISLSTSPGSVSDGYIAFMTRLRTPTRRPLYKPAWRATK
ncbi:hypothetical protein EDD18DRAFT_1330319 [Armillaria luteobubalina]|uniref:Uncharacterized protein n=1 Tax=Armillaria luteobubalina TaxID=153913 RepID=A0AA39QB75_9AGAR|nr:hypothetical protein EDD18DRAFT_1330319 [Armillaria luteobubalina]